ncbi:hypothetical protein [Streptomyces sp. WMMB 714]|uniref:hypothetical protein n=1 Tax=Streptomyces sp. WMMB 714 TaxID=1286822 RepID=UPI001112E4A2|nr:hypothetical protein [Streptomyces sp. WMMB 714]
MAPREVIRECYETELPEEFFLISEVGPYRLDWQFLFTNQPWQLAVPLSEGGPPPEPYLLLDRVERRIFGRDPGLIPLVRALNLDAYHGGLIICYHVDELSVNCPITFGIPMEVGPDDEIERYDSSLLGVIHQHHSETLNLLIQRYNLSSNRGAGAVDWGEVEEAREAVAQIEELQLQVESRNLE